jgi:hypothetical protein
MAFPTDPPSSGLQPAFDGYKDRATSPLEFDGNPWPWAPLNVNVQWAFNSQVPAFDLHWELPASLPTNGNFQVLGVNLYRAFDSEWGPYQRINTVPMGGTFYRDSTLQAVVAEEVVQPDQWLARGSNDPGGRYIFRTRQYPIISPTSPEQYGKTLPARLPSEVTVTIDGVPVIPAVVYGQTGEIELSTLNLYDMSANTQRPPLLPKPDSVVKVTYQYNLLNLTRSQYQRIFYRVTTVGIDQWSGALVETPLDRAEARFHHQMENMDYIWQEAIHRNQWILFQGGERVKVFIRKQHGPPCPCVDNDLRTPRNNCKICFGTAVRGGYEGPYEIILAPPDTERSLAQGDFGRSETMTYDVWTGPSPLLCQRDFFVKMNGDRYSIGPVRVPTNRGNHLQQHFNVWLMSLSDIRQQVPVTGTEGLAYPQTRVRNWDQAADAGQVDYPQITDKCNIPEEREQRGRTVTYENIVF